MLLILRNADEGPHAIDKLSNFADSHRYLRNALPPYDQLYNHRLFIYLILVPCIES
jgi:hypothetical protein